MCPRNRLHPPGNLQSTAWVSVRNREPALASFLTDRPRCQGPSPSAVSARLLRDRRTVTWEPHRRRTPDVGDDSRPKLP